MKPLPRCRQAAGMRGGHCAKTAELQHNMIINNFKKKIMLQFCNLDRVMEPETIGKNGASSKNLTSRRTFMKRIALSLAGLIVSGRWIRAQNTEFKPMQMTNIIVSNNASYYDYPTEYQAYIKEYADKYHDSFLQMMPRGYLSSINAQNPFRIGIDTQVVSSVKVKYALYTYKKTFPQDGKRNYWQGIVEPGLVKPLTTQADIDKALDKIYEFPVVTETASGYKELNWDGYTDPKFTGQKYAVRDCLYVAAYNADTDELIDMRATCCAMNYVSDSIPGIVYRIDQQKDDSGKIVNETLSGKVILAYPDNWPIKKITALIITEGCGFGALTFDVINQGADAIAADINRRIPGDVVAHLSLTNPTIANDNKDIKIFEWNNIQTEDGKDFIPDLVKNPRGYGLGIIIDMDEMTFTGIKNGYITYTTPYIPPIPKSYTDIESIEKTDINITSDENGFVILCSAGVSVKSYAVYDIGGRALKTGNLSGLSRETIIATELLSGIYFVQLTVNENGREKTVTKKVIIQ